MAASYGDKVKWLLSVGPKSFGPGLPVHPPAAEANSHLYLDLDSHAEAIREVVSAYAALRLSDMVSGGGPLSRGSLYIAVRDKLRGVAPGSFICLNAALAVVQWTNEAWNLPGILDDMSKKSRNVKRLYSSARDSIYTLTASDAAYCTAILSVAARAYRPLSVAEMVELVKLRVMDGVDGRKYVYGQRKQRKEEKDDQGQGKLSIGDVHDGITTCRSNIEGTNVDGIAITPAGDRLVATVDGKPRHWNLEFPDIREVELGLPEGVENVEETEVESIKVLA
ncbi:uncharacterized protein B0H64DRAFT_437758 [Chaetomium fimeti]|uniref:Uncharacterized protein n=1 Tax=Chaetomium fimeti TaxID=1854472 RepID=A0AAE0HQ32_9PEZI|nr:hypothetical protein B0H64DRAFT_437758 [Chaetomium fimeti]